MENKYKNELLIYRRRMSFSRKHVAQLLGHRNSNMLNRYENGRSLPPLRTALRLEIIYRVPVAFLYSELYQAMRDEIRSQENQALAAPRQSALF